MSEESSTQWKDKSLAAQNPKRQMWWVSDTTKGKRRQGLKEQKWFQRLPSTLILPLPHSIPSSSWLLGIRDTKHRGDCGQILEENVIFSRWLYTNAKTPTTFRAWFQLAPKVAEWRNISKGTEKSQKEQILAFENFSKAKIWQACQYGFHGL